MRVLGIAVKLEIEGRPTARGVVLDDSSGSPTIVIGECFELTGDDVDIATQLHELGNGIRTLLKAIKPSRVVVRRAGFPPMASRTEGPKLRLLAEGAIVSAARGEVVATYMGTGADIGNWDGSSQDVVDAQSRSLVKAHALTQKWADPASAALGAIAHS